MANHDNSYKRMFAHADLVRDLLQGFVHEDWVEDIDPDTFERVTGTYIGPTNESRESDMVWRVRLREEGHWLYVYILLEFQSTVDPTMALRRMVYLGLLLQDLADLVDPVGGGLEAYRPRLRYFLLDEAHLGKEDLAGRNVMSAIIRLEQGRGPDEMRDVVAALAAWLDRPEKADLRRAIAHWIRHVLLPARLPGVRIPEVEDLMEVRKHAGRKNDRLDQGLEASGDGRRASYRACRGRCRGASEAASGGGASARTALWTPSCHCTRASPEN